MQRERLTPNQRVTQQTKIVPPESEPVIDLDKLEALEIEMKRDLIHIEKDIYITEAQYIKQSTISGGNIFKGWDAATQNNRPLAS